MTTTAMSQDAYVNREVQTALGDLRQIEGAPLAERQDARSEFTEALRNPSLIAERLAWLFNGSYGYGQMRLAQHVLSLGARSNKEAQLVQLIGVFEWRCPRVMGAQAWKTLSTVEQSALSVVVVKVMIVAVMDAASN